MPQFVAKQPNGKYAVFSTVVDDFVAYDATRDEIIEFFRESAVRAVLRESERGLSTADDLGEGRFEKCIGTIAAIHGEDASETMRALLSQGSPDGEPPQGPPEKD